MKTRKIHISLIMFILLALGSSEVWARVIQLNSGKVIKGKVVEESMSKVKIDTGKRVVAVPTKLITFMGSEQEYKKYSTKVQNYSPKVEVYLADWCPFCNKMERFLKSNKISYTRYNIDITAINKKYKMLGEGGIPLVIIDEKYKINGFHPDTVVHYLKKARNEMGKK